NNKMSACFSGNLYKLSDKVSTLLSKKLEMSRIESVEDVERLKSGLQAYFRIYVEKIYGREELASFTGYSFLEKHKLLLEKNLQIFADTVSLHKGEYLYAAIDVFEKYLNDHKMQSLEQSSAVLQVILDSVPEKSDLERFLISKYSWFKPKITV